MYDNDPRMLLSLARAALTDPAALPTRPLARAFLDYDVYAAEKIDEVLGMLDAEDEPARALQTIGRLIADVADGLDDHGVGGDGEPFDTRELAAELHRALDIIDGVSAEIEAGGVEILP